MNSFLSDDRQRLRDSVLKLCEGFDDAYWLEHDRSGQFPEDFHNALAAAGWLGIAMPEEYGGSGLGIGEAAVVMQAIAESGAAMSGASAVHMNIFGLQPVVVFGTGEQKSRMLPPLIRGQDKACFAVTEADAGLNTTQIRTRAERCPGGYRLHGSKIWISTAQVATTAQAAYPNGPRYCSSYRGTTENCGFYSFKQCLAAISGVGGMCVLAPMQVEEPEEGVLPSYEFEPEAEQLLDALLPKYVTARIYNCLLQAAASELASRQKAMKSATDNAEELIKKYTRLANQARQAEITQEISEIVGGASALADAS